ncbi:hypothetical protein PQI07_31045 [Methylobacterium sp. 092160098-2]|uniref:hypothetical protein n=1 Tax=Methylobacterium sp. 092160098-2 TaxID=3025129 RepID=UPI002381C06A|nr:hypothetical protein [Methylobacterium sp. 092160098-2]MDE4915082.1 hypothetical protein [Methylobacterium sp. 092160098-2]
MGIVGMRLSLIRTLIAAGAIAAAAPAIAEGCRPVDLRSVDPATTVGRKAWIYEDAGAIARRPLAQWASATTSREIGPGKFVIEPPSLSYGQPVTIVRFERGHSMQGEYVVQLVDGTTRRVERRVVKLHEFWRCRPEVLLDTMRGSRFPSLENRLVHAVWATVRNRKAVGLESWGAFTPVGEIGRMAFLICDSFVAERAGDPASRFDVRCQGFEPGKSKAKSYQLRHEDIETVSPTSMRVLFEG